MENSESVTGTCAQQQHCVYGTTSGMTPNGTGQKLFEKNKKQTPKSKGGKKGGQPKYPKKADFTLSPI
jgi:hypothetical protein